MIHLRPYTRAEYHEFFRQYVPDPMMDQKPYQYNSTHIDCQYNFDLSRHATYPTFGIFADDQPIGILSLKRIDHLSHRCEIGLMMANDDYKNKGYGTQALKQGISLAAQEYAIKYIYADTMGRNVRMQHILVKLGFKLVELIPQIYETPDGREDRLVYLLEVAP